MTNLLIDGMDATDPVFGYSPAGASGFFLGLDELAEVRVLTQTFNAEYGNGAAARLGLPRTTLVYRMRKLGIAREQGSKFHRGRVSRSPDSPAQTDDERQTWTLDVTGRTAEGAMSEVGTA